MTRTAVSKVLVGTASWCTKYGIANSSVLSPEELPNLVRVTVSRGFSGFDTAQDYEVRAEMFAIAGAVELYSKVSHHLGFDAPQIIRESLLADLRASKRDIFDGLAVHSVSEFLRSPAEATKVMEDLKQEGITKSWGVSLYTLEECREVLSVSTPDYIQAPVSALDARFTTPAISELFQDRGTSLHGRSVYLQGALLLNPSNLPTNLRYLVPGLSHVRELAEQQQMPIARFLLNCVTGLEGVSRLVIGVNSASQLEETFSFLTAMPESNPSVSPEFVFTEDHPVLDPRGWKGIR